MCLLRRAGGLTASSVPQLCEEVAARVLGRPVFVSWPHLEEARVVAVSDGETR